MNKIALLNDAFRTSLTGGTVLLPWECKSCRIW